MVNRIKAPPFHLQRVLTSLHTTMAIMLETMLSAARPADLVLLELVRSDVAPV